MYFKCFEGINLDMHHDNKSRRGLVISWATPQRAPLKKPLQYEYFDLSNSIVFSWVQAVSLDRTRNRYSLPFWNIALPVEIFS